MDDARKTMTTMARRAMPGTVYGLLKVVRDELARQRRLRRAARQNRHAVARLLASGQPIKLELGAGPDRHVPGWTTVDISDGCDLCLDLSHPLPFPDASVTRIYSSHLFEHLAYPQPMKSVLAECRRVLKPGGRFRIVVPNARIYLDGYARPELFNAAEHCLYQPAYHHHSKIDYVNYIAYMDGQHHHLFDEENLLAILSEAGFRNATLTDFDPELDLEARRHESIYAEAEK